MTKKNIDMNFFSHKIFYLFRKNFNSITRFYGNLVSRHKYLFFTNIKTSFDIFIYIIYKNIYFIRNLSVHIILCIGSLQVIGNRLRKTFTQTCIEMLAAFPNNPSDLKGFIAPSFMNRFHTKLNSN